MEDSFTIRACSRQHDKANLLGAERESAKKKLQLDGELGQAVAAAKTLEHTTYLMHFFHATNPQTISQTCTV